MKKPFKKAMIGTLLVSLTVALTGCGGAERLVQTAEEVAKNNSQNEEQEKGRQEKTYKEKVEEWKKMYSKYGEQTREETLKQIDKKNVGPANTEEIVVKDAYTDPDELARFASDLLFNYYRGDIHAEDYVVFLEKYGSSDIKKQLLTGKHDEDVKLMASVQSKIRDQGIDYVTYEISKARVEGNKAEFYRKMTASNGLQAFYRTELIKENGHWYFHNDEPSVPVAFD
jgi:hypothetical protein